MKVSDSHHFRKTVAGWCMVAAPLLALISFVISPRLETKAAKQLVAADGHPDRYLASGMIGLVAIILLVGAVLGLMHMLREREVALGHVGGVLAMVGTLVSMAG